MIPENGERSEYGSAARGLGPLFSGLIAATLIALTLLLAVALGIGEQKMLAQVEPTMTATATPEVVPASPSATALPTFTQVPSPTPTAVPSATFTPIAPASATPTARLTPTPRPTRVRATPTSCVVNPWGWDDQYTVQSGDTLYRIAVNTGTTLTKLIAANCLTSDTIYPGQKLWVLSLPPTAEPTVPPPEIVTFTLEPPDEVILGDCVLLSWEVQGVIEKITLTADGHTLVADAAETGDYSDCPTEAGTRQYVLKAEGPDKNSYETETITVIDDSPPVADFSASPTSGLAPLTVSFTDQSTGGAVSGWSWDFGDGDSSDLENPSHKYITAGTYTVILTVTGLGGSDTETKTDYISVTEPAPEADFSASPTSGDAPLTVSFTDQSTGGAVSGWSWDFGDGGSSTDENPSHPYTTAGTYTVILTVTGPGGSSTETKTDYISVTDPASEAESSGLVSPGISVTPLAVALMRAQVQPLPT